MSEDNWPIAKSIGKWSEDQFYEGFGEGIVGIHVRRDTKMQYTHLKKRLINKFGKNGRNHVIKNFANELVIKKFREVYKSLLE